MYLYIYILIIINQYILLVFIYSLSAIPYALLARPGPRPAPPDLRVLPMPLTCAKPGPMSLCFHRGRYTKLVKLQTLVQSDELAGVKLMPHT